MCIAGKMLAWRPVLYIIHTVYDPGGLYAPQAANHIKIMHLRIVGNHSQHGQHNRFTLVQRKRQSPPDSQPEVLTYTHVFKGVWTPPLTPPPPPGLQLYHNCTITYNHSKLTEMNSPPWGQKWSVDWYVCSGPHFLLAVWSSWVLSYEVPNQFSVTGWIVGMTAK